MTLADIASLATAAGALIGAIAASVGAIRSMRNGAAIQELHVSVDGRLTDLLATTRAEGFSAGSDHVRTTTADAAAVVLDQAAARAIDTQKSHMG
jgi:hypothetical protein